ncbi:hypothetical protein GCM10027612_57230 [Microbispora bryophytorum subsp. camponoti]
MPPRTGAIERVALLIGQLGLGGAERQLSLLALGLRERGVDVHVLLLARGGPHEAALLDAGITVHPLGFTRSGPLAPVRNVRAFCRMTRLLRRVRPDVLHAYLPESYLLGVPAARLARVPVVIAGRRGLSRFNKTRALSFTLGTAATRLADHVVANAAAVAQDARSVERIPARKITVIYNGLARSAFDRVEPERVGTGLPVVLCVARLVPEKGLAFLIEAAAILARRGGRARSCSPATAPRGTPSQRVPARLASTSVSWAHGRGWGRCWRPRTWWCSPRSPRA